MANLINCNRCAVHNCTMYGENIDASDCSSFKELAPFRLPLLMHLLTNSKPQPISTVLERARLQLKEHYTYPFFKFRILR